jgi:hypothetical protein
MSKAPFRGFSYSGGRIRTCNLRVMSPNPQRPITPTYGDPVIVGRRLGAPGHDEPGSTSARVFSTACPAASLPSRLGGSRWDPLRVGGGGGFSAGIGHLIWSRSGGIRATGGAKARPGPVELPRDAIADDRSRHHVARMVGPAPDPRAADEKSGHVQPAAVAGAAQPGGDRKGAGRVGAGEAGGAEPSPRSEAIGGARPGAADRELAQRGGEGGQDDDDRHPEPADTKAPIREEADRDEGQPPHPPRRPGERRLPAGGHRPPTSSVAGPCRRFHAAARPGRAHRSRPPRGSRGCARATSSPSPSRGVGRTS